jgi:hypothetical protein
MPDHLGDEPVDEDDTFTCYDCSETLEMDLLAPPIDTCPDMLCLDCYDGRMDEMTDEELEDE